MDIMIPPRRDVYSKSAHTLCTAALYMAYIYQGRHDTHRYLFIHLKYFWPLFGPRHLLRVRLEKKCGKNVSATAVQYLGAGEGGEWSQFELFR